MYKIVVPLWIEFFLTFAFGITLAYYGLDFLAFAFTSLLLLLFLIFPHLPKHLFIAGLILLAGTLYLNLFAIPFPLSAPAVQNVEVRGKVISYPRFYEEKCSFILKAEDVPDYQQRMQVFAYFLPDIKKGDEVIVKGRISLPSKPGNPGEFDYPSFLKKERIYYILTVKKESDLKVTDKAKGINFFLNNWREKAGKTVKENLPKKEAAVLSGMLLGKKEEISPESYKEFRRAGIAHLFAVSGLHVGFLVILITWILSFFSFSSREKIVISSAVLIIYGSIIGWPVSVMRAIIMAVLGMAAFYLKRENGLLNSLGLSGFIILLIDPYTLFKMGFQLSFAATWGLVYLYPCLKKKIRCNSWLSDLILVPFSAQLAVLPLIAYYFYLFNPVSIVTNILVSYLAGGAIISGFLGLFSSFMFPFLSPLFLYPAGFLTEIIVLISKMVIKLPGAYIWVKMPSIWLVMIYYAGILIICFSLNFADRSRKYFLLGILMVCSFIIVLCLPPSVYNRGLVEVVFIDVGHGDSILIKTPQGKFILIDGGGSRFSSVVERKLMPYISCRGINHIFMVINSHPDIDHLQGLELVLKERKVQYVALPEVFKDCPEYSFMKKSARNLVWLKKGDVIESENDFRLEVLYPEGDFSPEEKYNNFSLVIYLKYKNFSLLLPGDIEREGIEFMLNENLLKKAVVVKVPHHGSRGSLIPEFYKTISPEIAVLSVGKNNFGHPHPEVIKELTKENIEILRTDKKGAITLFSNGSELRISTFKL
ncbi:DNA internalization-related competence protein ComEC/Rec2 [Thermosyntropha sp.]|uniref:DNA internalization-related competence protein ComEC/Rec2 n=1 Tax=Thermosyntropha sp. TaxID=2740820 RepID=UPI0025FD365E|nr:DNA internalization-related competence protein ComEC/Rec2 [Thermosyntropha sp.]MBO8158697.1 DNA internalization-related competence protein ComEC/Rec2 [Thermosyntropha sp.]